jgi:DNA-binding SARP family transcriptional activator
MTHLAISLLGSFGVSVDGQPANDFDSNKVRALLAYLAVESDRPHRRETLAGILWPEAPDRSAFNNLRYSLSDLRQNIGDREARPPFLLITHDSLQFNRASDHTLDVTSLERCLNAEMDDPESLRELAEAVSLYRGWFLEGFSVSGSPPFEEWAVFKREQIGRQALRALNRLADHHERRCDYEQACAYASRQIELEPWQEEAHRQLMRALALSGRRSAALHQYEVCRRTLLQELNVEPATETTELYRAIRSQSVQAVAPPKPNPYKGLHAFREEDAGDFFGRDGEKTRLLHAVRSRATVMLAGSSGSGKSSLVNAGLLPQLRLEGGWAVAVLRPGAAPFRGLAAALAPLLGITETSGPGASSLDDLSSDLATGRLTLEQAAGRVFAHGVRTHRLLVVVDQLEDLLDSSPDDGEARRFLDWLSLAVSATGTRTLNSRPPLALLLVIRDDCLAKLAAWPDLAAVSRTSSLQLSSMAQVDIEQAAARPAQRLGANLEPGLLQRLVGDASGQPGGLPLLELTLTEVWQCQQAGGLTHAAYDAIGTMDGVAVRHAGSVYGRLDPAGQGIARRLLLQMVRPGIEGADVRQSASPSGLAAESLPVLRQLIGARLIVASRGPDGVATMDLPHDGLVRHWAQLRTWMDADREFRCWLERTRVAQRDWQGQEQGHGQSSGTGDDLLLRGAVLDQARAWLQTRGADASAVVRQFVAHSESAEERRRAAGEDQRQREAEQSLALAAAEGASAQARAAARRQFRRLRFAIAVLAVWSLVVTAALLVQWLGSR